MSIDRFVIDGHDAETVEHGYRWLLRTAQSGEGMGGAIFVHGVQDIRNLEDGLSLPRTRRLLRDRRLTEQGVVIEAVTARSPGYHSGPVLAVWVTDEDLLDRLDKWRVPALCAVPWGDAPDWKAKWRPADLRTGVATAAPMDPVNSPVVRQGLITLTELSNLANGLDRYNRDLAAQVFISLARAGEPIDVEEIRAWAARHGWGYRNAAQLAELVRSISAGRRVRTGSWRLREDIVAQWRHVAAGNRDP